MKTIPRLLLLLAPLMLGACGPSYYANLAQQTVQDSVRHQNEHGFLDKSAAPVMLTKEDHKRIRGINTRLAQHLMLKKTQREERGLSIAQSKLRDLEDHGHSGGWGIFSDLKGSTWRVSNPALRYVDFTIRYADMLKMDICDYTMGCMVYYIRMDKESGRLTLFDWYGGTWIESSRGETGVMFHKSSGGLFSMDAPAMGPRIRSIAVKDNSLVLLLYGATVQYGDQISLQDYAAAVDAAVQRKQDSKEARSEFWSGVGSAIGTTLEVVNEAQSGYSTTFGSAYSPSSGFDDGAHSRNQQGYNGTQLSAPASGDGGAASGITTANEQSPQYQPVVAPPPNCRVERHDDLDFSGSGKSRESALKSLKSMGNSYCRASGGPRFSGESCESKPAYKPVVTDGVIRKVEDGQSWRCTATVSCLGTYEVCEGRGPTSVNRQ